MGTRTWPRAQLLPVTRSGVCWFEIIRREGAGQRGGCLLVIIGAAFEKEGEGGFFLTLLFHALHLYHFGVLVGQ